MPTTYAQALADQVAARPDAFALVADDGTEVTFAEIEAFLIEHPAVATAKVVGARDATELPTTAGTNGPKVRTVELRERAARLMS